MILLFDTHPLLWAVAGNDQFSRRAEVAARDTANRVYVSEASLREIAERSSTGALHVPEGWLLGRREMLASAGIGVLDVTAELRQRARALKALGGDRYDQLIGAQALLLAGRGETAVLARDPVFERYGIRRIW